MIENVLQTGLIRCYDAAGREIDCPGTGQDAETRPGLAWSEPRFEARGTEVLDRATGLIWSRNANPAEFPLTWEEALDRVRQWNEDGGLGRTDWRLPNRRELRSLIDYQRRKPALPPDHPFENVFSGWHWTSTSAAVNPAYAWYVHTEGGRMFYGRKTQMYLVWPVGGTPAPGVLPATGADRCYDADGREIDCAETGQDGRHRLGTPWPDPRFDVQGPVVVDGLTGLTWLKNTDAAGGGVDWDQGLALARRADRERLAGRSGWRLPTINELESLVDVRRRDPALPEGHPFENVGQVYLSSTSSGFEPDWVMVLHFHKGAVGVGQKKSPNFLAWLVQG